MVPRNEEHRRINNNTSSSSDVSAPIPVTNSRFSDLGGADTDHSGTKTGETTAGVLEVLDCWCRFMNA
jgi:hypothetical protein